VKAIRTGTVKLNVDQKTRYILSRSFELYTNAYNFCSSTAFQNHIKNDMVLHNLTYRILRETLPSQLSISCINMALASWKSLRTKMSKKPDKTFKCPHSKRTSILLDSRSHTIWFDKQLVSILTCSGRIRLPLKLNSYFQQFVTWKHTSAQLVFKNNEFFLKIQFEKDFEDIPKSGRYIGIDRGIKKIAVISDGRFFGGGTVRRIVQKYRRLRSKLQAKGTKSAKRHLSRVSGKEHRFRADINHQISKQILEKLAPGDTIVLENLSGIRNKRMRKKLRTQVNSWSYYQLEQFIKYKSEAKSIHIEYVDARHTSQRCSCCGSIKRSNRKTQASFECKKCGFKLNADLNAARNIVLKHLDCKHFYLEMRESDRAEVNQPNVAPERSFGSDKPQSFRLG